MNGVILIIIVLTVSGTSVTTQEFQSWKHCKDTASLISMDRANIKVVTYCVEK